MPGTKRGREAVQRASRRGHQEKKYYDQTVVYEIDNYNVWAALPWDVGGAADSALICTPIQGNNIWDRTGRFIEISEVRFKGRISWNATNMEPNNMVQSVRIVLVLDKQVDKRAWAGVDTVFQTAAQGDTQAAFYKQFAPQNLGEFGRYQILKDKVYNRPNANGAFPSGAVSANEEQIASTYVKISHKFLRPLKVNYGPDAENGDEQNVVDNGIRMLIIPTGDSATYTGNTELDPNLRGWCRTGFYDHKAVSARASYGPRGSRTMRRVPRHYGYMGRFG